MKSNQSRFDAIIVGSGPNGLSAAITLARHGLRVLVFEAAQTQGGGMRTADITLPGFRHDVCSSVFPLVPVSPFFRQMADSKSFPGMIEPAIACVHLFSPERAIPVYRDLERTAQGLGTDGYRYSSLVKPFLADANRLFANILSAPLRPQNPLLMMRFGMKGLFSAVSLARHHFSNESTRGMFGGMAAHSMLPPDSWMTGGVGLMFCIAAHATGWPIARGGAGAISNFLVEQLRSLGGEIRTGNRIVALADLPESRVVLFDTSPSEMLNICRDALPKRYHAAASGFRHGPGVFKIDWALDGPIPWAAKECRQAGTVHLSGTMKSIREAEQSVWANQVPQEPFLLVTQPSLFDHTRAPPGKHVAWAYCHVPRHCNADLTTVIENRIKHFAPGFRQLILARSTMTATDMERYNTNYIGGDIGGGEMSLQQTLFRPVLRYDPWSTPNPKIFICSASTPPGPGVHGMCGYHAARSVMSRLFRK